MNIHVATVLGFVRGELHVGNLSRTLTVSIKVTQIKHWFFKVWDIWVFPEWFEELSETYLIIKLALKTLIGRLTVHIHVWENS